MNIEDINLGEPPTGAGGDTMRTAFGKTNQNFGAAKQALENEVQTREQLLATQRDHLIALIESVNGPLPALRADLKVPSFGSKNAAGLFLPCDYSDLFTLSAPSPKWVWNAQGQLVEIPAGQPAWDHDPVTGEPLGQRLEGEATNFTAHSEDAGFWSGNVAGGTTGAATVTPGYAESPNGNMTASRFEGILGDSNLARLLIPLTNFTANGTYAHSVYLKSNTGVNQTVYISGGGGVGRTYVTVTPEWKRFVAFSYHEGGSPTNTRVGIDAISTDAVCDILVWGSQFEEGEASSYIPTNSSAVTRAADVATIQNVDTAEWFNADAFTLYAEVIPGDVQNLAPAVVLGATAQDRVILFFQNGEADAQVRGNQGITSISPAPEVNAGDRCRFAVSYRPGTAHISFNGVTQAVVNELDETPTKVAFGSLLNGTYRTSLALSDFRMMERALSAAELQELTS